MEYGFFGVYRNVDAVNVWLVSCLVVVYLQLVDEFWGRKKSVVSTMHISVAGISKVLQLVCPLF